MRTDKEIATEALRRAEELRRQTRKRQARLYVGVATAACLILVVGLSVTLSTMLPDADHQIGQANKYSATLLLSGGMGGYALMGVIGFMLGVVVTLMARKLRGGKR